MLFMRCVHVCGCRAACVRQAQSEAEESVAESVHGDSAEEEEQGGAQFMALSFQRWRTC